MLYFPLLPAPPFHTTGTKEQLTTASGFLQARGRCWESLTWVVQSDTPDPVCCTKALSNHLLLPICIFEEWKMHTWPLGANSACGSLADKDSGMGRSQHSHMDVMQLNSLLLFPKTHLVGNPLRLLSVSPKQK